MAKQVVKRIVKIPLRCLLATLICIIVGVSLFSCVEDLPFHSEDTSKHVVNCMLTNDSVQTLTLSWSTVNGESTSTKEVKADSIVLYQNDSVVGCFERKSFGYWTLNYTPIARSTYHLEIALSGGVVLKATTVMPGNVEIAADSIDDNGNNYFTQSTANNPCWVFTLEQYSYLNTDSVYLYPDASFYLCDGVASNHPLADNFNQDITLFEWNELVTDPAFSYYLRLKSSSDNQPFPISFRLQSYFNFAFFRTASTDYDQYLKTSLQKIYSCIDEDDPAIWFDESTVYSNIENGIGIFGAYSDLFFFYSNGHLIYSK
jgi:hypothetical protein